MRCAPQSTILAPVVLLTLGLAQPVARAAVAANWPQFRGNALHTAFVPVNVKLPLTPAWTWRGNATAVASSPTIVDGTVYIGTRDDPDGVGTQGSVIALDLATGALKWRYNTAVAARTIMTHSAKLQESVRPSSLALGGVDSTPAVANGMVYVTSSDGALHALTTAGVLKWRVRTGGSDKSSPAVVNGVAYLGSGSPNKDFWGVNAATGVARWRTVSGLPDPVAQRPGQYVYSSQAVAGGVVYGAANDGGFYALDAATGALKWRFETRGGVYMHSPTVAGSLLIGAPGDFDTAVYAIDVATGKLAWKYDTGFSHSYVSSPAYDGVNVYVGVGDPNQQVIALDALTGKPKWRSATWWATAATFTSSPAVANNLLLVGAAQATQAEPVSGRLLALDKASGTILWQAPLPKPVISSPSICGNYVVVGCMDGTVRAYTWTP